MKTICAAAKRQKQQDLQPLSVQSGLCHPRSQRALFKYRTSSDMYNWREVVISCECEGRVLTFEKYFSGLAGLRLRIELCTTLEFRENRRSVIAACMKPFEQGLDAINRYSHVSTRQNGRLVRDWVVAIGLEPSGYGTRSMRRTKAAEIYSKTENLRAVQLLLGHTKIDSTVRYLGFEVEDVLGIVEKIDI